MRPPELTKENQGYWDRLRRAQSWADRAKWLEEKLSSANENDPSTEGRPQTFLGQELFICYWVALNALYGQVNPNAFDHSRKHRYLRLGDDDIGWFLDRICELDSGLQLLKPALNDPALMKEVRSLLRSRFLLENYWRWGYTDEVKREINDDADAATQALEKEDFASYLKIVLWGRMRVLRNQIFHGGPSNQGSRNTDTLEPALNLLRTLVPTFITIMESRPDKSEGWPQLPFPRKGSPQNPETKARRR